MAANTDARVLSDLLVDACRNNNEKKFNDNLPLFIEAKTHLDDFKFQRFKSVFENACSFNATFAVKEMLNNDYCRSLIFPEEKGKYDLFKNGLFIAVFHDHKGTLEELNKHLDQYLLKTDEKDLYLELAEGALEGNSSRLFKNYLNKLNSLDSFDPISITGRIIPIVVNSRYTRLTDEDGSSVHSGIFTIETLKVKNIPSTFFQPRFFIKKLEGDDLELVDYLVSKNLLKIDPVTESLINNNQDSSFFKISTKYKLQSELNKEDVNIGKKTKFKV